MLLERITRLQNPVAKIMRVDDAREMQVVCLPGTAVGGFKLEGAQVEVPKDRSFNERHFLNVFERDGFFYLHQNAFAKTQFLGVEVTVELVEIVPCSPLADAQ